MTDDKGINVEKTYQVNCPDGGVAVIKADQSDECIYINDLWYTIADAKIIVKAIKLAIKESQDI